MVDAATEFKKSGFRLINPNGGEVSFSELKQKDELKKSVFISKPQSQTEEKKKRKARRMMIW